MRKVRIIQYPGYARGEIANFPDELADLLVRRGQVEMISTGGSDVEERGPNEPRTGAHRDRMVHGANKQKSGGQPRRQLLDDE